MTSKITFKKKKSQVKLSRAKTVQGKKGSKKKKINIQSVLAKLTPQQKLALLKRIKGE